MLALFKKEIHHQLVINAPKVLAIPSRLMPFYMQQKGLTVILNRLFDEQIKEGDLDFLKGKWLTIAIDDLSVSWQVSFNKELVIRANDGTPDVTFTSNINDLILIAGRKEDPDTLFFQRRLNIEGDTELGLEVKNLLDNIDFDNFSPFLQKLMTQFSLFVQQGVNQPNHFMPIILND
ncbi:ubiquinone anaerobic biosynthesis accessory factor UbiT [Psychromonas sp. 14N.309.X.WAT.B.A12]|uniref:ubiquinone anaerobic biosynthesis accessory factor UbiT n=1 Tax=unclassified Psychromonas TaxID=2614957 RepID=UPI0025B08AE4|nr:SCP2 sterol-binding domain-containing protein [Psychromonas sp. 14N.309.X.WAT.B.A12]MDN2663207.1 SCP2 sterol-binding domain-containing protein [Psychromonas sp. 14N.309.X.WAT.B.A12]